MFSTDDWLSAYEYFRTIHPELKKQDIKSFAERYRFSAEEERDLREFYEQYEGDVTHMLETIVCSENSDLERFIKFFEEEIAKKALPKYKIFDKTKGKV